MERFFAIEGVAPLHITPITMPSFEEVEALGAKPFTPPESSSNLQRTPSTSQLAASLGLTGQLEEEIPETQIPAATVDPVEEEKEKGVQKYVQKAEVRIQEKAEELYAVEERLALKDDAYLPKLLQSSDPTDRKLAEKILKRNAEHFGAISPDEYTKTQIEKIEDPIERKLALQDLKIQSLEQKSTTTEWSDWKRQNKIGTDFEPLVDEIREQYPQMAYGDVVALARGKKGMSAPAQTKSASGGAVGAQSPGEEETSFLDSPLARRLVKDPKKTMQFAKEYLRQF